VVFEDEYMIVVRDPVSFPSGAVGTYLRVFPRPALTGATGAVMLPLRDGNVLLRRVFRHATRGWELECPRGFRNSGADLLDTVRSEVSEELGLAVLSITPLGQICGDTGLLAGHTEGFAVTVAHGEAAAAPEKSEAIGGLEILPPARLATLLASGKIRDGYTLSMITLAQAKGILTLRWPAPPVSAHSLG
jgi:ADP-ribose pyrophosphatase